MTTGHPTRSIADDLREQAKALARRGFKVFQLEIDGNTPAHEGWQTQATCDATTADTLWRDPFGVSIPYNIGIATGSGLTVLDVDVKNGQPGLDSLDELVTFLGLDDETLTVRTRSGGLHLYYASDAHFLRNSASMIRPALDIRSEGGYVVAPGSSVGGRSWEVEKDLPIKPIAPWFAEMCGQKSAKAEGSNPLVELDTDEAISRAVEWLKGPAPETVADSGTGDHTAYKVACGVKDFGVSEGECLSLILEHYDPAKCHPPQGHEIWETKAANAYRHGLSAPGVKHPMADFEVVELEQPESAAPKPAWPHATPLAPFDPVGLPHRRWIIGNTFARSFASAIIAPGGTGKTQFIVQAALAVATGRGDIVGRPVIERAPVWYWNQEDDLDELRRRVAAAMQHFGVSWDDLVLDGKPMLYLDSGVERPLTLAVRGNNEDEALATPSVKQLKQTIKERGIGLFIADPLVELHKVKENSNEQMRQVWEILRRVAVECHCATAVGAHTRKPDGASSDGHAGDINTLRGGGSQAGVMRTGVTMFDMSTKDAKTHGIVEADRHLYVRLDDAKTNLFLKSPGATWYKRTTVLVGGVEGQPIGVLAPVRLTVAQGDDALLDLLAEALTKLPRSHWHAAGIVLGQMDDLQQTAFGTPSNRARTMKELFDGASEVMTDFGKLVMQIENGKGTRFKLEPSSSPLQGPEELAK